MNLQLLDVIVKLLRGEGLEERVKLCFVLGEQKPSLGADVSRIGVR